jgi:hypothetical protein
LANKNTTRRPALEMSLEAAAMKGKIKGRIFLVGCPRSGTTLLQSLIAAHPQIASFPETHFLVAPGRTRRGRWLTRLGLASPEMREQLERFLDEIGQTDTRTLLPRYGVWIRQYASALVRILDVLSLKQGKPFWLEKTPGHLHYVELLERYIPGASFIHILRDGTDVVASLYEVTRDHPQYWGGPYSVDQCITRWNKDANLTQRYCLTANHHMVRYERLIENPEIVLADVCRFIGVPFEPAMITRHNLAGEGSILKHEIWKQSAKQDIHNAKGKKFEHIFEKEQRTYILERLVSLDEN